MTNPILWITLLCLFGSVIYKKWVSEKALRKLYTFKMKQDTDSFLKLLDSPYCRFNFSQGIAVDDEAELFYRSAGS